MCLTKSGKARTNYVLNKKYALNSEQCLITGFYGTIVQYRNHTSAASFSAKILQILTSTANISRMQAHIHFLFGTIVCHYSLYMYLKYGLLTGSGSSDSYPKRFLTVFAKNLAYFCKFLSNSLEFIVLAQD